MSDISKKTFWWGLGILIVLRFFMVILLMNNIPFTDMQLSGFRPNFGGSYWPDEINYFNLAKSFVDLKPAANVANIGYPLFLAPIIYFTGAVNTIGITKPVFVIQAFLFFSLAVILVALVSFEIFKNRKLSFAAAALFTIAPYILYAALKLAGFPRAIPAFHYQMWINIAADYLSAILVYLGFYIFIKRFNEDNLNLIGAALIGAIISAAALVRIANILYLPLIFFILIWIKKYKEGFIFGTVSFLVYLPQWIYNFYIFGSPFTYGYRISAVGGFQPQTRILGDWFSFSNILIAFRHIGGNFPAAPVLIPTLLFIIALGFLRIFGRQKIIALVLAGWVILNIGFYIFFVDWASQLRYFIPAIPPLIILFFEGLMKIKDFK